MHSYISVSVIGWFMILLRQGYTGFCQGNMEFRLHLAHMAAGGWVGREASYTTGGSWSDTSKS